MPHWRGFSNGIPEMNKPIDLTQYVFSHDKTLRQAFVANPILLNAYCTTHYQIQIHEKAIIACIGQINQEAQNWFAALSQGKTDNLGLALIGAENPYGELVTSIQNENLHEGLVQQLSDANLFLGQGIGRQTNHAPGTPAHQERFCVAGPINLHTAISLSIQQHQVAFVFIDGKGLATLHITMKYQP